MVLLHSNTALLFIATILLKMIFSNFLGPLKLKTTRRAAYSHQCFQVYLDSTVYIFCTSKKDHVFFIWKSSNYAIWYRPLILGSYICLVIGFKLPLEYPEVWHRNRFWLKSFLISYLKITVFFFRRNFLRINKAFNF